ncbi:hypothetical protein VTJ49DRAFT_5967 [Mycothermus thermophilus]|uniref:BZIP domain-containing protein n=1 Tax=Humicola insolens TaxID=85995 RepID=A0ABR3V267_HUMIN
MDGPNNVDVNFGEFINFEESLNGDGVQEAGIAPQPASVTSPQLEQQTKLGPFPGSGSQGEFNLLGDSQSDFGLFSGSESHLALDPFLSPQSEHYAELGFEFDLELELQLNQEPVQEPFEEPYQEPEPDPVHGPDHCPDQDTDKDLDQEQDQDPDGDSEPDSEPEPDPEPLPGSRARRTRLSRTETAMSAQPGPSTRPGTNSTAKPVPSTRKSGPARQSRSSKSSKKDRLLERNWASAKRYREKKKQWLEDTQSRLTDLEEEIERKNEEILMLEEESHRLQMELMRHIACGGARIPALLEELRLRRLSVSTSTSNRMFSSLQLPPRPAPTWASPPSDWEPGSGATMPSGTH